MADAKLNRAIRQFRQNTGIDTIAGRISNDGNSPYTPDGLIWVQVKSGDGWLPRRKAELKAQILIKSGNPVRLGKNAGGKSDFAILGPDIEAIRATGENPLINNGADPNVNGFVDTASIAILKVTPTSPPSTSLSVWPAWLPFPDGLKYFGSEQVPLASEITALSSGFHQLVGLFVDRSLTITKTTSTEQDSLDLIGSTDVDEVYDARPAGSTVCGLWIIADGMTDINSDAEYFDPRPFISVPPLTYDESNISNPPTDAELDTAFGAPATVGKGFMAVVNDAGGGSNFYIAVSDGTNWWQTAMTKAV